MQIGQPGAHWGPGLRTALADPAVISVSSILEGAANPDLLNYAMYATSPLTRGDALLPSLRASLTGTALAALNSIDPIASNWRSVLSSQDLKYRKGAIVQKLVERLLGARPTPLTVHSEKRLVLSDGTITAGFDVIGSPPTGAWEAHECKAGWELSFQQERELPWVARQAQAVGDDLKVVVTSAASRTAILGALQPVRDASLLHFVSLESFFSLATTAPADRVPTR